MERYPLKMKSAHTSSLVQVKNISRLYRLGEREVVTLKGVSLGIAAGTFVALKGRSGAGKTTLLNLLGGLDQPTEGEIWVAGRRLSELGERERTRLRRRFFGFVFQSFSLFPTYSAFENVELALRIAGLPRQEREAKALWALRLVGLEQWREHRPEEMSGGQQQRLAIARAIANSPALLLADEPTGELDSENTHQIFALFRQLVDQEEMTILTATHDPIIDHYADMVYTLMDGLLGA